MHVVDKQPVDFSVSIGRSYGKRRVTFTIFGVSCTTM